MCLGVPGRIEEISESDDPLFITGKVNFGGVLREVILAGIKDAKIGDWVIVHAGFALSRLNEDVRQVRHALRWGARVGR